MLASLSDASSAPPRAVARWLTTAAAFVAIAGTAAAQDAFVPHAPIASLPDTLRPVRRAAVAPPVFATPARSYTPQSLTASPAVAEPSAASPPQPVSATVSPGAPESAAVPTAAPAVDAPAASGVAVGAAAPDAGAEPAAAEPAVAEPAVSRLSPTAPLPRVALLTTSRAVVLLPGVSQTPPPPPAPRAVPASAAIVLATLRVDDEGQRWLAYSERPVARGTTAGCGSSLPRAVSRVDTYRGTPLGRSSTGASVRAAQQLLCAVGYDVAVDGVFGEEMDVAVRVFQSMQNAVAPEDRALVVNGLLDPPTREALVTRARQRIAR